MDHAAEAALRLAMRGPRQLHPFVGCPVTVAPTSLARFEAQQLELPSVPQEVREPLAPFVSSSSRLHRLQASDWRVGTRAQRAHATSRPIGPSEGPREEHCTSWTSMTANWLHEEPHRCAQTRSGRRSQGLGCSLAGEPCGSAARPDDSRCLHRPAFREGESSGILLKRRRRTRRLQWRDMWTVESSLAGGLELCQNRRRADLGVKLEEGRTKGTWMASGSWSRRAGQAGRRMRRKSLEQKSATRRP